MKYEELVRDFLQCMLHERQIGQGSKRIQVEDVHLEPGGPYGDEIVLLFREVGRPHCLFGFRTDACEPPPADQPDWKWDESSDPQREFPQGTAEMIFANLQEHVEASDMGLPANCNPDGVTWI
jgi:hypothetical protein